MTLFLKWWNKRERFRNLFWRGSRKTEDVGAVLADLREFCYADRSCVVVGKDGHIDTHATTLAEGRRETWLRIIQVLELTDEQLQKMREIAHD